MVGVFGAKDFGFREIPTVVDHEHLRPCRQPVLAGDKVRYVGDPIVAVVAESRYIAEDAAAAVAVAYEPLEAVRGAEAAMAENAALLHERLGDNIAADFTVHVGDVDAALRSAEVVTRGRYYVHRHTGMPLETRGVAARYDAGTGSLTLWSSTQWPHTLRDILQKSLGLAEHKVRVVAPDVGGGFGVKQDIYPEELVLALLAMRLRVPVKWVETRREHLTGTAHAREQWADVELAARRDGTIVALSAELLADMGAYTRSLGVLCPSISSAILTGPYRIRHYRCRVRAALTSRRPRAPTAGPACPRRSSRWSGRWITWHASFRWILPSCAARTSSAATSSRGSPGRHRTRFRWSSTAAITRVGSTPRSPWRATRSGGKSRRSNGRRGSTGGSSASASPHTWC